MRRASALAGLALMLGAAGDQAASVAATPWLPPARLDPLAGDAARPPLLLVVDIATQRLAAYRAGVAVLNAPVSTGRAGHPTPQGVFAILEKDADHRSNLYGDAPMPFMQRLTWGGVALHGGPLPGYPDSHGCIRLPHDVARRLFRQTDAGALVMVVNSRAPGPGRAYREDRDRFWRPDLATRGPVSIVVSGADRRMLVLRGGTVIGDMPVDFPGRIVRPQAFHLAAKADGTLSWQAIALPGARPAASPAEPSAGRAPDAPGPFLAALQPLLGPGATLVAVPASLSSGIATLARPAQLFEDGSVAAAWAAEDGIAGGR